MAEDYDVAIILNYYRPYVSGLTETAAVVAEGLAARGWRVAVVAARHDAALAPFEVIAGVEVHRTRVALRYGKGVLSPTFLTVARDVMRRSRVVNLHLPMLEAGVLVRLAAETPVAVTYQCDVNLGNSIIDRPIVRVMDASTRAAMRRADEVIVSSMDYASASRVAGALPPAPAEVAPPSEMRTGGNPRFREGGGPHIGFLGRIVEEKGLEYLVRAFHRIEDPTARLLVGGDYEKVAGGSVIESVRTASDGDQRIRFLGFLPDEQVADFYASLDVFALPSVNSLEAFGIVQVEAMLAGVPVVASDLPGVRMPIRSTGFGRLVPPRDVTALSAALAEVLASPKAAWTDPGRLARDRYSTEQTVTGYEQVLRRLADRGRR